MHLDVSTLVKLARSLRINFFIPVQKENFSEMTFACAALVMQPWFSVQMILFQTRTTAVHASLMMNSTSFTLTQWDQTVSKERMTISFWLLILAKNTVLMDKSSTRKFALAHLKYSASWCALQEWILIHDSLASVNGKQTSKCFMSMVSVKPVELQMQVVLVISAAQTMSVSLVFYAKVVSAQSLLYSLKNTWDQNRKLQMLTEKS